jgi:hypothetical protein
MKCRKKVEYKVFSNDAPVGLDDGLVDGADYLLEAIPVQVQAKPKGAAKGKARGKAKAVARQDPRPKTPSVGKQPELPLATVVTCRGASIDKC